MIIVHVQHRDGTHDAHRIATEKYACAVVEAYLARPLPPALITTETRGASWSS